VQAQDLALPSLEVVDSFTRPLHNM
jgi:hypothetical protein